MSLVIIFILILEVKLFVKDFKNNKGKFIWFVEKGKVIIFFG